MEQKKLTELSLDELWQLFPITLTAHQDYWADWYKEEAELLKERLPCIERISHIGSTAIKGIWAKPTIDILVEIPREEKVVNLKGTIERCGYICMAEMIIVLLSIKVIHYKDLPNGYFIYTYVMREIMMNCISEIIFKQIRLLRKNMNGLNLIYGNNTNMTEICTLPTKVIS